MDDARAMLAIICLFVLAAVLFGIAHDLVTAHICVEYFTIGHPPVFRTTSPTLLALGWGIIATWWAGMIVGVMVAIAARVGRWPKLSVETVRRWIMSFAIILACAAVIGGLIGFMLAATGVLQLMEPFAQHTPANRHVRFITAGGAHTASYAVGFLGGLVLTVMAFRKRARLARKSG